MRVIDFSHFVAGPYCTQILGDLGADVIKIESPVHGDSFRIQPPEIGGESVPFMALNRNKRSVALDLTVAEGREAALALIDEADVLVENFSTGVMQRLGLDYATVSARNPGLVYCSVSAAGREGPMASRLGFDPVYQAELGFIEINGHPDAPGVVSGAAIVDLTAAMMASNAIMAALLARVRLGKGQRIEVALFDQAAQVVGFHGLEYLATGKNPPRIGNRGTGVMPVGVYQTATGPIFLCCANDRTYRRLALDVFGSSELADSAEYATNAQRSKNRVQLDEEIHRRLAVASRDHWVDKMRAAGVPGGPVRTVEEAFSSKDMRERGLLSQIQHPSVGPVSNLAPSYRLSLTPVVDPVAAPTLGQHTDEVLASVLGYDEERLAALARARGCDWTEWRRPYSVNGNCWMGANSPLGRRSSRLSKRTIPTHC
ncbi:MAG: CoA transferase [Sulfuricaulis sp.]|nr:CoA transferase [Sulfuricaulis sp.]